MMMREAFRDTALAVLRDKGVLLIMLLAPVIYGFFYPWPYGDQAVTRVPVAVVDQDHSSLSRQVKRFAQASPRLDVRLLTGDLHEAQQALWRGEIEGYALLPADLKRDVLRGAGAVVTIEGNGAYALLNKAVLYGFSEAVGTVSAGVEIRKLQAGGQGALQAAASRSPLNTELVALFNPTEGYGSYVVPAVALLILQQTLLMGCAMLAGTWAEAGRLRAGAGTWLGRLAALAGFGLLSGLFYFGWVFWLQDYPRGGNPLGALVLLAFYVPAICTVGLLLGCWFRDRERALQVLLFTALPMAFLSGFSWPVEALPGPLQALRWLFPSTAGIQASLRLNQMGAPLHDVLPHLAALALLALAGWATLVWVARPPRR
ncbi:ABC-2 type transport system permease protein [Variovorax sp. TBS-050B]|uniref:ABC transporter permease n=1 Tax=Variovorax sp. TBS-050B TaxID=2940551 RepID=UPI0024757BFA|nr:ABC transporter permease [Variovorax sp. TBS-050B]MDH6590634.1 ABC-2 type transport system permease protein [Variovorax sp. TBS-050B]